MVDIDSETLFNSAAAVLTTAAALFFISSVELGVSPVSRILLVLAFLSGVFAISQRTDDRQVTLLAYGVVVVSIVGIFLDLVNTFDAGNSTLVAGLLVLAAVLFGLRTRFDDQNRLLTSTQATYLLGAVAVLAVVVLVVDVGTGGLTYELQPQGQVEITESPRENTRVASVAVTNPTPLPERVKMPNYAACAAGDWSEYRQSEPERDRPLPVRVNINVDDGYNDHLMSFGSKTYSVSMYLDATNTTGEAFPVQRTDACPSDESGAPYIAIFERPESADRVYPT
ncbi:MAG: hypothetical protein ABEI27_01145 [Halobellus sp.]|uniref:hypothetical protein n=1 Tax=Halobellus sp. TaxID=1979212 RepID=UPI0035D4AD08